MKKRYLPFIFLILIVALQADAQINNCTPATAQADLFGNNIKARIQNGGDLFWDRTQGLFQNPQDPNEEAPSTFFAAALWIGGLDAGGNLKLAAQTYNQSGNDFWAGPLDDTGNTNYDQCIDYNRFWRVQEEAIIGLKLDFEDNGNIDTPPDNSLLEWPAKGNPYFSSFFNFDLPPNTDLAPFFDQNNDGIYNPWQGDYPVIDEAWPNLIAKDLLWCVFNDKGNIHSNSGGDALGIEVHLTAYSFDCQADSILANTIFTRHKIINKSTEPLYDVHTGLWTDFDLGCWNDDYIGSAPELNTYYIYNGTNNDDENCLFGTSTTSGYGINPPVQAVTYLNNPLTSFMAYDNAGGPTQHPNIASEFYNYIKSTWRDNSPLEHGGDGYNEGTFSTNWMYPSNPNDSATSA